jgi:hypothetical protein
MQMMAPLLGKKNKQTQINNLQYMARQSHQFLFPFFFASDDCGVADGAVGAVHGGVYHFLLGGQ